MISLKKCFSQALSRPKALAAIAAVGLLVPGLSSSYNAADANGPQPAERSVLADGTYLFGQSPQPDQIGSTYTVFSVKNSQIVGAFYQPRSSFDCFSGQLQADRLAVTVVDSYSQSVYPYEVALSADTTLVAGNGAGAYGLEGFHRIETLSTQDAEILSVCAADLLNP